MQPHSSSLKWKTNPPLVPKNKNHSTLVCTAEKAGTKKCFTRILNCIRKITIYFKTKNFSSRMKTFIREMLGYFNRTLKKA